MSKESREVVKDLYILVGNYEATTKQILGELKIITKKLDVNEDDHGVIKTRLEKINGAILQHENKISTLESTGVSRKTNQKIDVGLALGILNAIAQIIKSALNIP